MTPSCADLHCLHCGAAVSSSALTDNWCEECGKRLPSSFRAAVQPDRGRAPVSASVLEDDSLGRQRLLCGGVIIALISLLALVVISNLL
jgi:hypothetical protein